VNDKTEFAEKLKLSLFSF